mmetsp:Transcript_14618/g.31989  ORF Transcript_14618/g.31989 Transcript_14618/m.31989 type:complete len:140 (+) Transcript_14618:138-557(+)
MPHATRPGMWASADGTDITSRGVTLALKINLITPSDASILNNYSSELLDRDLVVVIGIHASHNFCDVCEVTLKRVMLQQSLDFVAVQMTITILIKTVEKFLDQLAVVLHLNVNGFIHEESIGATAIRADRYTNICHSIF